MTLMPLTPLSLIWGSPRSECTAGSYRRQQVDFLREPDSHSNAPAERGRKRPPSFAAETRLALRGVRAVTQGARNRSLVTRALPPLGSHGARRMCEASPRTDLRCFVFQHDHRDRTILSQGGGGLQPTETEPNLDFWVLSFQNAPLNLKQSKKQSSGHAVASCGPIFPCVWLHARLGGDAVW